MGRRNDDRKDPREPIRRALAEREFDRDLAHQAREHRELVVTQEVPAAPCVCVDCGGSAPASEGRQIVDGRAVCAKCYEKRYTSAARVTNVQKPAPAAEDQEDKELSSIAVCVGTLSLLDAERRARIVRYLTDRYLTRACKTCGCTDARGCERGCYWVSPDLCSSCAPGEKSS